MESISRNRNIGNYFALFLLLALSSMASAQDYHYLIHKGTGLKLYSCASTNGTQVVTADASVTDDCAQWEQISTTNNFFFLKNKATGKFIRPDGSVNGSPIVVQPDTWTGNWTQWRYADTGDDHGHLVNRQLGKHIYVGNNTSGAESQPDTWTGNFTRWQLVPAGDITIEAETATFTGTASTYNDSAASGGQGVQNIDDPGDGLTISNAPAASTITVNYASFNAGSINLLVNGVNAGRLHFNKTNSWVGTYNQVRTSIDIPQGADFTIRFDDATTDSALNVDSIVFSTTANVNTVRLFYHYPADKSFRQDYKDAVEVSLSEIQNWYELKVDNGKTFSMINDGAADVIQSTENEAWFRVAQPQYPANHDNHFLTNTLGDITDRIGQRLDNEVWVVFTDIEILPDDAEGNCEQGGAGGGGITVMPADDIKGLVRDPNLTCTKGFIPSYERWLGGQAHEIGHAFGLPHPYDGSDPNNPIYDMLGYEGSCDDRLCLMAASFDQWLNADLTEIGKDFLQRSRYFEAVPLPSTQLKNTDSQRCADIRFADISIGTPAIEFDCFASQNFQWQLRDVGNHVQIINALSNICLGLPSFTNANDTELLMIGCTNDDRALWTASDLGNDQFNFINKHSNKCIDVVSDPSTNLLPLKQFDCNSSNQQRWELTP